MRTRCSVNTFITLSGPHPTYLVTANDPRNNNKAAITVAWGTPISVNPPLFGVVISPNKVSHTIIKEAGVFTVNILSIDEIDEIWWAGSHTGRQYENKIKSAGLTAVPGKTDKNATSVIEAMASFECKLKNMIPVGNHTLFIGEVVSAEANEEYFDLEKGKWIPEKARLIFHHVNDVFVTSGEREIVHE